MSFQTGLSGLNAASRNLDVIGNNIANANTVGMKSSRSEFAELMASSLGTAGGGGTGIGVSIAAVSQQFSQGNINITGNDLDVAINGGGFFQLQQADGSLAYTRNGTFKLDSAGNIVTNDLSKVMGYPTDITGKQIDSTPIALKLPTSAPIAAKQTTNITAAFNLDQRVAYPIANAGVTASYTTAAIAAADYSTIAPKPASYTTGITAFDYSTIAGTQASYTTGITAFDYSTIPFTQASYTTAAIASKSYGTPDGLQVDGTSDTLTSNTLDFANHPQVDASLTSTNALTNFDFSGGMGQFDVSISGLATPAGITLVGNYGSYAAVASAIESQIRLDTSNPGFTVSLDGTNHLVFGNAGSTSSFNIVSTDTNAINSGITSQSGTSGTAAIDLTASFVVDGTTVNLTDTYADTLSLKNAITSQLTSLITGKAADYTGAIDASNGITLSMTGSIDAVVITDEAAGTQQTNANAAGFSASPGVSGYTVTKPEVVTITPPGGTPFDVSLADTMNGALDLAYAIENSPGFANSGFAVSTSNGNNPDSTLIFTAAPESVGDFTVNDSSGASFFASSGSVSGVATSTSNNATFDITNPDGTTLAVALDSNITDADSMLQAIQAAQAIQVAAGTPAGFTVAVIAGKLMFTEVGTTAGNFSMSGTNSAGSTTITAGTPVDEPGKAPNTSNNATFNITNPDGTTLAVALDGNITDADSMLQAIQAAQAIQVAAGTPAGFTVAVIAGKLMFTEVGTTAGNFSMSGTNSAGSTTITAGTPVDVPGALVDTSKNATFTAVGPGGTAITVNLISNVTSPADMATAIQGTTGYDTSGFTVAVGSTGELVFTATNPETTGAVTIGGTNADILTTGGLPVAGVTPAASGVVVPRGTYGTSLTAYDSQGAAHPVSIYFTKVNPTTPGTDEWAVYDSLTGASIGSLVFDVNGKLSSSTANTMTITPGGQSIVQPFPVTVDFSKMTQNSAAFTPSNLTQNGYASGELVGMKIGDDGVITARYSNGQTQAAGKLAMADFRNVQGLTPTGGGNWMATFASGERLLGAAGEGRFGALRSGSLEESNVDLTAELVNMMTAQRAYQANAQTIKTQDQVLSTLVNLR